MLSLKKSIDFSIDQVEARCGHVPECGGCCLQQMDYSSQLDFKEEWVQKLFSPFIESHHTEVRPILGCENPWRYRNKMEFSFSQNRAGDHFLGLMLAGGRGKVLNLSECMLVSKWYIETLSSARDWWKESGLSAYHHRTDSGHLRTLTLREAKQGKGKMAMLTVSGNPSFALKKEQIQKFVACIKKTTPDEHLSIFLQVHQIAKGRPTQFFEMHLHGPDHITERLEVELEGQTHTLDFKISPTSFFQPNTVQAQKVYSEGLQMLSLCGARLFDLYCGGATIGLAAAKSAKEVMGIELNHHSVFDAKWNQEVNGIQNFTIHRGDVGEVLTDLNVASPDIVVVDPPRVGLGEIALQHVKNLGAKEILYISCSPITQAENIQVLIEAGYRLKILQPVDQFPHTAHVENICLLQKG
ncbi:MAG: 23S rRNA (uracil-C(5))-methyltransferase RlmCD [Chlamydiae bacterium]|nr:23S rRNA (uracil-C(5))-methyltransferase RlmCD [Chlamydiota bacterium]